MAFAVKTLSNHDHQVLYHTGTNLNSCNHLKILTAQKSLKSLHVAYGAKYDERKQ